MESDLSRVIDALPGLVWTALPDGQFDFMNQRWSEYTGLAVDSSHGRGWQVAVHPEDLPGLLAGWRGSSSPARRSNPRSACAGRTDAIAGFCFALILRPMHPDKSPNGAD